MTNPKVRYDTHNFCRMCEKWTLKFEGSYRCKNCKTRLRTKSYKNKSKILVEARH